MSKNVITLLEKTWQATKETFLWPPTGNMNAILHQLGQRAHSRLIRSTQPGQCTTAHLLGSPLYAPELT